MKKSSAIKRSAAKIRIKKIGAELIMRGMAEFKKQWQVFKKMVDDGSLILLTSMQSEIEKKLNEMAKREKIKFLAANKTRKTQQQKTRKPKTLR